MTLTLGSLFDGAGTVPFAAKQCGIKPLWASEIEPFPIEVTKKRLPEVKHLGDITKINGTEIEPVDIIAFGSPCQDLSIAGKRAGLDGERSGLFVEAVRIIKEMRRKTDGKYPTYAVWENVPGAFSSNKGEDFRVVLEEICKIKGSDAVIPRPPKRGGKWSDAGLIVGDGYSVAWRVLDAQFWGVPQRRRRIFLVVDFGGGCAGEILFKRDGLSRNFAQSRESWKGIAKSLAFGTDAKVLDARGNGDGDIAPTITGDHNNRVTDYTALCVRKRCGCDGGGKGCLVQVDKSGTIACNNDQFLVVGVDCYNQSLTSSKAMTICARGTDPHKIPCVVMATQQGGAEVCENLCPTITAAAGMSGNNQPVICYALDRASFNQGQNAKFDIGINDSGIAQTVVAKGPSAVGYGQSTCQFEIRRLTPTECARLQGMPDWWCDDVPHKDAPEYKMWGSGMALPNVLYVLEGIAECGRTRA